PRHSGKSLWTGCPALCPRRIHRHHQLLISSLALPADRLGRRVICATNPRKEIKRQRAGEPPSRGRRVPAGAGGVFRYAVVLKQDHELLLHEPVHHHVVFFRLQLKFAKASLLCLGGNLSAGTRPDDRCREYVKKLRWERG